MNSLTDRPIRLMTPPTNDPASPTPFIPQSPTVREITERPISRDELRKYRETVVRAHRMIESALDKLIAG